MFLSKLGYSELVQRLFEKMTFFRVDPLTKTRAKDDATRRDERGGVLSLERYGDQQLRRRVCPEFVADRAMFLMLLEVILFL